MKTDIEKSAAIVATLESQMAAISDKAVALASERRRLAYSSATGDAKAKSNLEKLNSGSAMVLVETENLHAALDEARHRLASAEAAAAVAERKAKALKLQAEVKEIAARIEARGAKFAATLAVFSEEFSGMKNDLRAARELGIETFPNRLVELAFSGVVSTSLRPVGLDLGDLLPPDRRHTAEALTALYATKVLAAADSLGAKAEAA